MQGHDPVTGTSESAAPASALPLPRTLGERIPAIVSLLTDLERLKLVSRRAYVSDLSRRESSAEHSWHLALGLLIIAREAELGIDLHKALIMALIHDACEIDAGDTPVYGPARPDQHDAELRCVERLASCGLCFGSELHDLWLEYEAQQTPESRWIKVLDRLMPFIVNLATHGKTWKESSVTRSQLLRVSQPVRDYAPELHEWMRGRIDACVEAGWIIDA
jgi:putative hydrolases of HD superfamily